jgi:hypothetical protein
MQRRLGERGRGFGLCRVTLPGYDRTTRRWASQTHGRMSGVLADATTQRISKGANAVRRFAALPRAILLTAAIALIVAACSTGSGNGGGSGGAPVVQPAPAGSAVAPGY